MEKELPKNWVKCNIADVFEIVTGNTPSKSYPAYYGNEIPWVKPGDITKSVEIFKTEEYLSIEGFKKSRKIPKGSVLVTCIGNLGNTAIAGVDLATNQQINSIVINHNLISKKYVYYYSNILKPWLIENSTSTTISMVNKSNFEKAPFIFPPLTEQNRIVSKLDSLFAQLESIKNSIKKLNTISDRFTYACLVESKLQKFYPREKIGEFLEEGKERIGEHWKSLRLIGVASKQGIVDLRVGQKETFEKYKIVRPGDFIYNTMRVNIGSIAIYTGTEDALTSPDYVVFRVKKHLSSQLLLNFLKSEQGLLEIGTNTKGSVRARLYFSALSEVRMPIAPLRIQQLAEKFLTVHSKGLSTLNNTIRAKLEELSKSILNKAFKGELTEQLETDGDARDLLKQIMKLKESSTQKNKTL